MEPNTSISPEERRRKYEQQTSELYAGLGEFVAVFELLVHAMRTTLETTWATTHQKQLLVRPALAELTADPIARVYLATMSEAIKQSQASDTDDKDEGQRILVNVCKRIRDLIATRNEIVHGTWFIGWASPEDTDFSVATGFKIRNTKEGSQHKIIGRTRREFDLLIDLCKELTDLANRIWSVLQIQRTFKTNFVWKDGNAMMDEANWTFKRRVQSNGS